MTSRTLRRRLDHGDVDGKTHEHLDSSGMDSLSKPLLAKNDYDYDDKHPEADTFANIWDDERRKEHLHWTFLFSNLIAQWAQWLERLKNLKRRLEVPFDGSSLEHQNALKQLWRLAYPDKELPALKSELWKDMGWQGPDPSTDFRGGGFISLENLIFFAKMYPEAFQNLLHKSNGKRAEWEYPFAVAGINISFMLVQMLDLQSGKPASLAGIRFLELLREDEMAFDNLYCVAFQMMDEQWLAKRASYMQFNDILKSTGTQLEHELAIDDISTVKDLPAYNLLKR